MQFRNYNAELAPGYGLGGRLRVLDLVHHLSAGLTSLLATVNRHNILGWVRPFGFTYDRDPLTVEGDTLRGVRLDHTQPTTLSRTPAPAHLNYIAKASMFTSSSQGINTTRTAPPGLRSLSPVASCLYPPLSSSAHSPRWIGPCHGGHVRPTRPTVELNPYLLGRASLGVSCYRAWYVPLAHRAHARGCQVLSRTGYDPSSLPVVSWCGGGKAPCGAGPSCLAGRHRGRRTQGIVSRCARLLLVLLRAAPAMTFAMALPCYASTLGNTGAAAPQGSAFSGAVDPSKGDTPLGSGRSVPTFAGSPEHRVDSTSVLTTFRVSPRIVSYSSWATTPGGGYETGAPILVRSGDTDVTVGYKLSGGRPSTVALVDTGAGAHVLDFSGSDPTAPNPLNAVVIGILAPASAADAIVDGTIDLPGITDARGWIAHGNEGQGDLLVTAALTQGPVNDYRGKCSWIATGGPSDKSFTASVPSYGIGMAALAILAERFLHLQPGGRLDYGFRYIIASTTNDPDKIGHYVCSSPTIFSVSLTPELVTRPGCLQTRLQPGGTCNTSAGPGDWSPAGTYSLNLQGSVLFS